jgi:hypothetical protein
MHHSPIPIAHLVPCVCAYIRKVPCLLFAPAALSPPSVTDHRRVPLFSAVARHHQPTSQPPLFRAQIPRKPRPLGEALRATGPTSHPPESRPMRHATRNLTMHSCLPAGKAMAVVASTHHHARARTSSIGCAPPWAGPVVVGRMDRAALTLCKHFWPSGQGFN